MQTTFSSTKRSSSISINFVVRRYGVCSLTTAQDAILREVIAKRFRQKDSCRFSGTCAMLLYC